MDKDKNISPNPSKPVDRTSTGQAPDPLEELSEETLTTQWQGIAPSKYHVKFWGCYSCGSGY